MEKGSDTMDTLIYEYNRLPTTAICNYVYPGCPRMPYAVSLLMFATDLFGDFHVCL